MQLFFLNESSRKEYSLKVLFRFISSLPPIILAANTKLLGVITAYTGLIGFSIMFIYPAILSYYSIKAFNKRRLLVGATALNAVYERLEYSNQWMVMYRWLTDSNMTVIIVISIGIVSALYSLIALIWL